MYKQSDLSQLSHLTTILNELLQKLAYNVLDIKSVILLFVKQNFWHKIDMYMMTLLSF